MLCVQTLFRLLFRLQGRPVELRACELGVLCRPDRDLLPTMPARRLMDALLARGVDARVNDPYGDRSGPGGAAGAHAAGRPTLMIEARQDLMVCDGHRAGTPSPRNPPSSPTCPRTPLPLIGGAVRADWGSIRVVAAEAAGGAAALCVGPWVRVDGLRAAGGLLAQGLGSGARARQAVVAKL